MDLNYVRAWLDADPDPETRSELQALLDNDEQQQIENLFSGRLSFGTAGLRAALGPGPMRMNRLTVSQTSKGLADFLNSNREQYLDTNDRLSIVIGYDGRKNSETFARDSAEIMQAEGVHVYLFDEMVPTPLVAFASKNLGSSAAVVITASHNPPEDNGYKVFLGGITGHSQITPPQDSEIAAAIASVAELNPSNRSSGYEMIGDEQTHAYLSRASQLVDSVAESKLTIVHTAMHGVGWKMAEKVLRQAGFKNLHPVESQMLPDGTFPTVEFPNPEEPGAMDLAIEKAKLVNADLILANDPDADRLAAGVKHNGHYQMLSGNQLGILLADYVAKNHSTGTLAASYVSSNQIIDIAKFYGLDYELTATGFKWISKVDGLIFGFEEALGYCVDPRFTADKDGLTAAMLISVIADQLQKKGQTLIDRLEQIAEFTGFYETDQISLRLASNKYVAETVSKIKSSGELSVDGKTIEITDLVQINPRLDMLEIRFDENSKALIRASGTEPKVKCYLETKGVNAKQAEEKLAEIRKSIEKILKQ